MLAAELGKEHVDQVSLASASWAAQKEAAGRHLNITALHVSSTLRPDLAEKLHHMSSHLL